MASPRRATTGRSNSEQWRELIDVTRHLIARVCCVMIHSATGNVNIHGIKCIYRLPRISAELCPKLRHYPCLVKSIVKTSLSTSTLDLLGNLQSLSLRVACSVPQLEHYYKDVMDPDRRLNNDIQHGHSPRSRSDNDISTRVGALPMGGNTPVQVGVCHSISMIYQHQTISTKSRLDKYSTTTDTAIQHGHDLTMMSQHALDFQSWAEIRPYMIY
ncbi:hypothetical protein J6590_032008 [Homalodisca vitripennis]|nr:hypothetical protein J6590_032008 [Homalodisca vitripennis]